MNDDLAVIRASKVTPQRVDWLWRGYLAFRKLVVLDGDPGLGKSALTIDLTARTTTRSPMPDGSLPDGPYRVLLLSAEDGVEDVIVPRLAAAGANRDFVDILDHVNDSGGPRPIELPGDVARIDNLVAGHATPW
jgi:putative DNA primase/helicase